MLFGRVAASDCFYYELKQFQCLRAIPSRVSFRVSISTDAPSDSAPCGLYVRFLVRSLRPLWGDAARLVAARMGYALNQVFKSIRCTEGAGGRRMQRNSPADFVHSYTRQQAGTEGWVLVDVTPRALEAGFCLYHCGG